MEQRREPRFALDQAVRVSVPEVLTREPALVRNASSRGLALETRSPIVPGTPIVLETEDWTGQAEAVWCSRSGESWLVGVELDETLCSLNQLGRKLSAAGKRSQVSA